MNIIIILLYPIVAGFFYWIGCISDDKDEKDCPHEWVDVKKQNTVQWAFGKPSHDEYTEIQKCNKCSRIRTQKLKY